jgi:hypothetical protein
MNSPDDISASTNLRRHVRHRPGGILFLGYIFQRHYLLLYAVGLAAIFAAMKLTPASDPTHGLVAIPWYVRPLEPLGYTLFITTLVTAALHFSFQTSIEDRFLIVKGAKGAGIIRLFATRAEAIEHIAEKAERAHKVVDILCVSGTSLFQRDCLVLREIGKRFNHNSNVAIRVLLLDPRSRFAIERSLREEGHGGPNSDLNGVIYPDLHLCHDTLDSLRQLEKVVKARSDGAAYSCRVRLYNSAPVAMYVRIDDRIFLEQYHFGIPTTQQDSPYVLCLGKAVPVVEVATTSELGHVMDSTFEYLWDWSENRELHRGGAKAIQESLLGGQWLADFEQIDRAEREKLQLKVTSIS